MAVAIGAVVLSGCSDEKPSPVNISVSPKTTEIPANTLRLYVHFSEPMARGQIKNHLYLENQDGDKMLNPFLNLGTELWNKEQTRLTLLFDPGRIKQGVGPNQKYGAPLEIGEGFNLVIGEGLTTADGLKSTRDYEVSFQVGAPIRLALRPDLWIVLPPEKHSKSPVKMHFDRLMDSGAATSLLAIRDQTGKLVSGQGTSDGETWQFTPAEAWYDGSYEIIIHPALEDIAGNNLQAAFDVKAGTALRADKPFTIEFQPIGED